MPVLLLLLFLLLLPANAEGKIVLRQEEGKNARLVPVRVVDGRAVDMPRLQLQERYFESEWSASNPRGVMLVSVSWPGATRTPFNASEYAPLSKWSEEASDGRFRWNPVSTEEITLPKQGMCDEEGWSKATRKVLLEKGYNLYRDYGALGIMLPREVPSSCVPGAYAYLGCPLTRYNDICGMSFYSSRAKNYATVVHELGHTLGLNHARRLDCLPGCKGVEYGDVFDPMGSSRTGNMFNPVYSRYLRWLDSDATQRVPLTSQLISHTLQPFGSGEGVRVVEVPLPPETKLGGRSPGKYILHYKSAAGADRNLWLEPASCSWHPQSKQGFIIHFQPSESAATRYNLNPYSTYLIPQGSDYDVCAETLLPGNSWYDPWAGMEFAHKGVSPAGATLEIDTAYVEATTLRFLAPSKKPRKQMFSYQLQSSAHASGLQKSDLFFRQGSCKIGYLPSNLPRRQTIKLRGCKPGRTQIGIRAGALQDEWWRTFPASDVLSPAVRVPRSK